MLTTLMDRMGLDRIGGFTPNRSPNHGHKKGGGYQPPMDYGTPNDRFGPATRTSLSAEAVSTLTALLNGEVPAPGTATPTPSAGPMMPTAPAPDRDSEPVASDAGPRAWLSQLTRPSIDQLSQIHRIVARYLDDEADDASGRMMLDLRRAGLHPTQMTVTIPADAAAPAPA